MMSQCHPFIFFNIQTALKKIQENSKDANILYKQKSCTL